MSSSIKPLVSSRIRSYDVQSAIQQDDTEYLPHFNDYPTFLNWAIDTLEKRAGFLSHEQSSKIKDRLLVQFHQKKNITPSVWDDYGQFEKLIWQPLSRYDPKNPVSKWTVSARFNSNTEGKETRTTVEIGSFFFEQKKGDRFTPLKS